MEISAKTLERYQKIEKVGEGTYGEVYKARDSLTNEYVALKKVRLENETQGIPATSMREISALKELDHPNIVRLVDLICGENKLYLVFEFITEDLRRFLKKDSTPLQAKTIKFIAFQILHAVCHCHSSGIIHRDLKPHNILINEKGLIKIADFGLARTYITPFRTYTHEVVTLWYRAPEILLGTKVYTPAVDMWSVGCILAEIFSKKPLFTGDSEIHQLFKIFELLGTPNESVWEGVSLLPDFKTTFPQWKPQPLSNVVPGLDSISKDLIEKMLVYDPAYRITAFEALNHVRNDYDIGVNTFSPEGRLFQVEYAIQAIKLGSSALGIRVEEGVVLAAEKRIKSKLMDPKSVEKILEIDSHIGAAISGLAGDAKSLVDFARVEAQNHRFTYTEPITVQALTQAVADTALNFGEGDMTSKQKPISRPYGVSLLIGGVDVKGPFLFLSDPSGTVIKYDAKGIGSADEGLQSILNEQYNGRMSLVDTEKLALSALKQVMEEKISKNNVELSVISVADGKFVSRTPAYIENIIRVLS